MRSPAAVVPPHGVQHLRNSTCCCPTGQDDHEPAREPPDAALPCGQVASVVVSDTASGSVASPARAGDATCVPDARLLVKVVGEQLFQFSGFQGFSDEHDPTDAEVTSRAVALMGAVGACLFGFEALDAFLDLAKSESSRPVVKRRLAIMRDPNAASALKDCVDLDVKLIGAVLAIFFRSRLLAVV